MKTTLQSGSEISQEFCTDYMLKLKYFGNIGLNILILPFFSNIVTNKNANLASITFLLDSVYLPLIASLSCCFAMQCWESNPGPPTC